MGRGGLASSLNTTCFVMVVWCWLKGLDSEGTKAQTRGSYIPHIPSYLSSLSHRSYGVWKPLSMAKQVTRPFCFVSAIRGIQTPQSLLVRRAYELRFTWIGARYQEACSTAQRGSRGPAGLAAVAERGEQDRPRIRGQDRAGDRELWCWAHNDAWVTNCVDLRQSA